MSDPDKSAPLTQRHRYLTPALERLGLWTYTTGASDCPPGVPFCVKINHVLFPTDGGFPR